MKGFEGIRLGRSKIGMFWMSEENEKHICWKNRKFGNWCKGYATKEIDGEYYCIFHAPKGKKWENKEAFNKIVKEKIDWVFKDNT